MLSFKGIMFFVHLSNLCHSLRDARKSQW